MKARRNLTAARAEKKETRKPTARKPSWLIENDPAFFKRSKPVAAAIVGTARRKENSTIVFRLSPSKRPPTMVAADLDTPGTIAMD